LRCRIYEAGISYPEGLMKRAKKPAGKKVSGLFIALSNTT
jgi:hypothetical protein